MSGLTSGVAKIAARAANTCALTALGGVKCWGANTVGQLGDNTTVDKSTPTDVSELSSGVAAIAVGDSHACALTTAGGAKCWGSNLFGRLGDNTTVDKSTPTDVSGLTSGVAAIAAGNSHTCALTTTGGVTCWGYNGSGQLGNSASAPKLTPTDVSGLSSGVAAITAGGYHTCALTTAGGVKCWGTNNSGQLGNSTTFDNSTPTDVSGLTGGVMAISAGSIHTCALTTAGGVKCWGGNDVGQLGTFTFAQSATTPTDASGLTSGVAAIATGQGHTCALTSTGGVKCWGYNRSGQLGDNTKFDKSTPTDVNGLTGGVSGIAAGEGHTCVLTTAGGVKCWGTTKMANWAMAARL